MTATVIDLLHDALGFTGRAWRRVWGAQALAAVGVAMLFVAMRGRLPPSLSWDLWTVAWAVLGVAAAPLAGALLRVRMGGAAARELGPAGLQLGLAEARLMLIGAGAFGVTLLTILPLVAVSALCFLIFRPLGYATLPGFGAVRVSFLLVALVWTGAAAAYAYALVRMSFALPASVGKRRLVLLEAWPRSARAARSLVLASLAALSPAALATAGVATAGRLAVLDPHWGALSGWPVSEAVVGGALFGAILAFIQAPLSLGVLCSAYLIERDRRRTSGVAPQKDPSPDVEPFPIIAAMPSARPS